MFEHKIEMLVMKDTTTSFSKACLAAKHQVQVCIYIFGCLMYLSPIKFPCLLMFRN